MSYYPEDGLEGLEDPQEAEDECYYGCDFCQDDFLRDNCGCIGCDAIAKPDEPATPVCPHCDLPTEQDGELNGEPAYTCKKCTRVIKCTKEYIEKLWEDLSGPKPLGLVDKVNDHNSPVNSVLVNDDKV